MKVFFALIVTAISLTIGLSLWSDQLRPKLTGGEFTLQSDKGAVSLKDFRGQWVILYFGFTACPDVCPTSLARWAHTINALSEEQQQQVRLLFISLDPERDTLEGLMQYSRYFHPHFIGLSGSTEAISDVATRYGVVFEKVEIISAISYTLDHSSYSYLINPEGKLVKMFNHEMNAAQRREALTKVMINPAYK